MTQKYTIDDVVTNTKGERMIVRDAKITDGAEGPAGAQVYLAQRETENGPNGMAWFQESDLTPA